MGCVPIFYYFFYFFSKGKPWNGLLIPTEKEFHDSIRKDFKGVVQHPVLKKWLYLPETYEDFETVASDIVEHVLMDDQRFGVEPKARNSKIRLCRANADNICYNERISHSRRAL